MAPHPIGAPGSILGPGWKHVHEWPEPNAEAGPSRPAKSTTTSTGHDVVQGMGRMSVDAAAGDVDEEEEDGEWEYETEEEEMYVTMEFSNQVDPTILAMNSELQIIGLDSETPLLRIGRKVYMGTPSELIGSELVFKDDADPIDPTMHYHRPYTHTSSRITFRQVELIPKDPATGQLLKSRPQTAPKPAGTKRYNRSVKRAAGGITLDDSIIDEEDDEDDEDGGEEGEDGGTGGEPAAAKKKRVQKPAYPETEFGEDGKIKVNGKRKYERKKPYRKKGESALDVPDDGGGAGAGDGAESEMDVDAAIDLDDARSASNADHEDGDTEGGNGDGMSQDGASSFHIVAGRQPLTKRSGNGKGKERERSASTDSRTPGWSDAPIDPLSIPKKKGGRPRGSKNRPLEERLLEKVEADMRRQQKRENKRHLEASKTRTRMGPAYLGPVDEEGSGQDDEEIEIQADEDPAMLRETEHGRALMDGAIPPEFEDFGGDSDEELVAVEADE